MSSVVVTGIGLVTPIGSGVEAFWSHLLAGKSGFDDIASFDSSKHRAHRGAEIRDFQFDDTEGSGENFGRATQFALTAARQALADAGLEKSDLDPARTGVVMATTSGEPNLIEQFTHPPVLVGFVTDKIESTDRLKQNVIHPPARIKRRIRRLEHHL